MCGFVDLAAVKAVRLLLYFLLFRALANLNDATLTSYHMADWCDWELVTHTCFYFKNIVNVVKVSSCKKTFWTVFWSTFYSLLVAVKVVEFSEGIIYPEGLLLVETFYRFLPESVCYNLHLVYILCRLSQVCLSEYRSFGITNNNRDFA